MKDLFDRGVVLVLWIVFIILAIKGMPVLLIILACLHLLETLFAGFKTGIKYGKGILETVVCCMVWGFIWWLPLQKRMKHDELTDDDFIEDGQEPWREK